MDPEFRFLTNGFDLQSIVSSCENCFKSIQHGRNIICHTALPTSFYPGSHTSLVAYIINTRSKSDAIGHWVTLIRLKDTILLCDGLHYVTSRPDVMRNIRIFSKINNCRLVIMNMRYQTANSSKCGFLAIALIAKAHVLPLKSFSALQKLFKKNSIASNERLLLNFAQKHFKFSL